MLWPTARWWLVNIFVDCYYEMDGSRIAFEFNTCMHHGHTCHNNPNHPPYDVWRRLPDDKLEALTEGYWLTTPCHHDNEQCWVNIELMKAVEKSYVCGCQERRGVAFPPEFRHTIFRLCENVSEIRAGGKLLPYACCVRGRQKCLCWKVFCKGEY